ncbi:hypothetical protein Taro_053044 [Colocasia esculenta]|uniref:Retrotransposon gag domain-containing protein n=1 Tax=Colocasia esculenta TaxID=4460 RepID=A0A843XLM7_COLES|nr:hypothetical protein [Colocasia esculenta]
MWRSAGRLGSCGSTTRSSSSSSFRLLQPVQTVLLELTKGSMMVEWVHSPPLGEGALSQTLNLRTAFDKKKKKKKAAAAARNGASDVHCNFRSLNPPHFSGSSNPDMVENWQEEIERIFQVIQCTNRGKVVLATFQFTKDARAWWKATSAHLPNVGELEWAGFLEIFRGKYFSERVKEKKAAKFAALK